MDAELKALLESLSEKKRGRGGARSEIEELAEAIARRVLRKMQARERRRMRELHDDDDDDQEE